MPTERGHKLKLAVYGSEAPTHETMEEVSRMEARRLQGLIPRLESDFPSGFGMFAADVRSWRD